MSNMIVYASVVELIGTTYVHVETGAIQNVAPVLVSAFPSFSGMYQRQISNSTFNLAAMH
jgi:hypothetical protein